MGVQASPWKEAWCLMPRTPGSSKAQPGGRKTSVAGGWGERGLLELHLQCNPVGTCRRQAGTRTQDEQASPHLREKTMGPPGSGKGHQACLCCRAQGPLGQGDVLLTCWFIRALFLPPRMPAPLGPTEARNSTSAMRQPGLGRGIKGASER